MDAMRNAVEQLRRIEQRRTDAYLAAFGGAGDDPDDPSIIAAVKQNRLAFLQIAPGLLESYQDDARPRPGETSEAARQRHMMAVLEFTSLVNGVIHAAWENWRQDFEVRMQAGVGG